MTDFKFKDMELTFPISVFISLNNYLGVINIYFWIFFIGFAITILTQLKHNAFAMAFYGVFLILYGIYLFLLKNPKLLLYPDKVVFVNHGLGKPKTLTWQDCIFDTDYRKDNINGKDTIMLYLLSQNDKGEKYRFCMLNLNAICFNDKQFSIDEHLEIFKAVKNGDFKVEN